MIAITWHTAFNAMFLTFRRAPAARLNLYLLNYILILPRKYILTSSIQDVLQLYFEENMSSQNRIVLHLEYISLSKKESGFITKNQL